jgi:phage terminase small subunit
MAKRGGYRVGGGRPRGSKNRVPKTLDPVLSTRGSILLPPDMKPLDYMLAIMNDPDASPERRDRMAIAAASFCHPRAVAGKKTRAAEDAETAGEGTDWGDDLAETVN